MNFSVIKRSHSIQYIVIRYCNLFLYSLDFETKVLRSLDEILDRQKKLEEQIASFSIIYKAGREPTPYW